MKKFIAVLLTGAMTFSLVACGSSAQTESQNTETEAATEEAAEETATEAASESEDK